MTSPDSAFLLCALGVAGILYELQRPGSIAPGVLGLGLFVTGSYKLWLQSPNPFGLALVSLSALLFAGEALWNDRGAMGILATCTLTVGCCRLMQPNCQIRFSFAIPICLAIGVAVTTLLALAKQARLNKIVSPGK